MSCATELRRHSAVSADCTVVNANCGIVSANCGAVMANCGDVNANYGAVSPNSGAATADDEAVNVNCGGAYPESPMILRAHGHGACALRGLDAKQIAK